MPWGLTFSGFFCTLCAHPDRTNIVSRQRETYKKLLDKIAEHGSKEVEELDLSWCEGRVLSGSRILIVLEMLYHKAVQDKNYSAAREYLDRMLGKSKESLTLTNGSDLISKISDEELAAKVAAIIKSTKEGGA